jgi:type 2A phosphatase activator TIP41
MDWAFSSPYKGTISTLDPEQLTLPQSLKSQLTPNDTFFTVQHNHMKIPLDKLGSDNPIEAYGEVLLYEDECGDKGYSRANVRYRVMRDCFLILLRSYVRIDSVTVRVLDTRYYHEFGSSLVLRDFSWLESSYETV